METRLYNPAAFEPSAQNVFVKNESAENRRKERNQFWLRLRHAVIMISNFRTFERSNVRLKENKPDGVDPNSNDLDNCVRKNQEKIQWFSAD